MSDTPVSDTSQSSGESESPKKSSGYPEEPLDLPVSEGGGFYAAALNSILHSRYTIIGKLGHGIESSVWLARDER